MLYILVGLPATGKTATAKMLVKRVGASVLNEDEILRELFLEPTHSDEERQEVYDEMFERAAELLRQDKDVILDATFIKKTNRDVARRLSEDYKIIEVRAPESKIKDRLKKRHRTDGNDANWEVYLKYKKNFEPILENHSVIENSKSLEKVAELISRL